MHIYILFFFLPRVHMHGRVHGRCRSEFLSQGLKTKTTKKKKKQNGCALGLFFYLLFFFPPWPFFMIPLPYFHAPLVFAFINPSPFFRDLNCYEKRPAALPSPATPSLPVISRLGSGGGALLSCYARCHTVIGRVFLCCLPGHHVATLTSHWEQRGGEVGRWL